MKPLNPLPILLIASAWLLIMLGLVWILERKTPVKKPKKGHPRESKPKSPKRPLGRLRPPKPPKEWPHAMQQLHAIARDLLPSAAGMARKGRPRLLAVCSRIILSTGRMIQRHAEETHRRRDRFEATHIDANDLPRYIEFATKAQREIEAAKRELLAHAQDTRHQHHKKKRKTQQELGAQKPRERQEDQEAVVPAQPN